MEEDEDTTFSPFWLPSTPRRRLRRSTSSLVFSPGAFVLLLLAVALAFIFVIIPSVHSFTSQIFRPNMVKRSWDSLNLVLVLFAIVCGFLGRNTAGNDDGGVSVSAVSQPEEVVKSVPSTPRQWYEYSDRTVYNDRGVNRVSSMRSSSSYPDLRQDSEWVTRDDRWRFHDDTHVSNYGQVRQHRRRASWHEEYDVTRTKNIPVDTFVIRTEQASPSSTPKSDVSVETPPVQTPSPPPSPPHVVALQPKRTYQAVGEKETRNDDLEVTSSSFRQTPSFPPHKVAQARKSKSTYQAVWVKETRIDDLEVKSSSFRQPLPVPVSQSPPKPAALPVYEELEVKNQKREKKVKKRGVATTKEFLITSLRSKKKKQRQKSVEDFETLVSSAAASSSSSIPLHPPPSPPPPPPPLPPPPSVFHSLFQSKKPKPKKSHHSHSDQPPPSPPVTSAARMSRTKAQVRPMMTAQKPPLPVKVKTFNIVQDEAANSGGDSPLTSRIPPPPPPPPFRMPEMKFVVHGDFVRIKSNNSSRSGSPDLDDGGEDSPTNESSPLSGNESPARPAFCPSPDVNMKADTFIARFRAGLRLEKINSVNERGRSNLGPGSGESLGPI